ncbi:MAG: hypothetical protein RLY31_244 [Bacteroidota bacterium]|jgi:molybdenum cofactor cytidylyltransferase
MTTMGESKVGAVVLAAGQATRMGACKQLLKVGGEPLVTSIIRKVQAAGCGPVVVVLGAYAQDISKELASASVHPVYNPDWESGMGGSISVGIKALQFIAPECDAALVTLCDQPLLTADLLRTLSHVVGQANAAIAACQYGGRTGPPAVFGRAWFDDLSKLSGPAGARNLLRDQAGVVLCVPFEDAAVDLDTPEALQDFLAR